MKRLSTYSIILATALTLGSCKKTTEGLNVNPNSPTAAPYALVLTGAEVNSILIYEGTLARSASIFARGLTGSDRQYQDLNIYNSSAEDYNDGWDNLFSLVLAQLQIVEAQALAVNDRKTAGIAEVQLAMGFGFAADLWGDIPFSQVGDAVKYPTPKFDSQVQVYAGVQALLDKAIANFGANVGVGAPAEIFFAGDIDKWTATANTLKARFFLHTRDYASAITYAKKGIADPANNLLTKHGTSDDLDANIYYDFLSIDRVGYMTANNAIAPAYLDSTNPLYKGNAKTNETARHDYYFQTGLNSSFLDPNVLSNYDGWGNPVDQDGYFGGLSQMPLATFQENALTLAEAYSKTGDDGDALIALNSERKYMNAGGYINTGYLANGNLFAPYAPTDFAAGGIANKTNLSQSAALLTEILKERYVTFEATIEQYNDVRRTGNYLKIPPTKGTTIPQRFFYAQDEINTNPNTPKESPSDFFKPTTVNSIAY